MWGNEGVTGSGRGEKSTGEHEKNTGESMRAINCLKVVGKRKEIICLPQPGGKHKK